MEGGRAGGILARGKKGGEAEGDRVASEALLPGRRVPGERDAAHAGDRLTDCVCGVGEPPGAETEGAGCGRRRLMAA